MNPSFNFFKHLVISWLVSCHNPIILCETIAIVLATFLPTAMNQKLLKAYIAQGKHPEIKLDSPCAKIEQRGEPHIDLFESLANNKKWVQSLGQ